MMFRIAMAVVGCCLFSLSLYGQAPSTDSGKNWSQWRGPDGNGVASHGAPPVEWSEQKNILWKIDIPGEGHATPIVWENFVFVLTAVDENKKATPPKKEEEEKPRGRRSGRGNWMRKKTAAGPVKFVIYAIDKNNGKIIWQDTPVQKVPHEGTHGDSTWASNSPVTDGEHLYAYFGSNGLFCYDMKGELKWKKDLGDMKIKASFGEGASLALHKDVIIVNWDHEGPSFITALDKKTGKERWKVDRDEATTWTTPLVIEHDGKPQVIVNGTTSIRSYDLKTGKIIWTCKGMTKNVIPAPVSADNIVYLTSGFRGSALVAVNLAMAKGDITGTEAVVWSYGKDTPYTPSPLLYGKYLYFLQQNNGVLTCLDAKTGEVKYGRQKLEGINGMYSSPVGAGGHVYLIGRKGGAVVIKNESEFKVVCVNKLEDQFSASPVLAGDSMILRGHKHLYCIGVKVK